MLETLLSSRVRARILTAIFLSPEIERNAWQLAQLLGENYSAVWKELNRLEGIGVLVSEQKGNTKAYRVNQNCPIEPELRSIVLKTGGVVDFLKTELSAMGTIHKAFAYGLGSSGKVDPFFDIDLIIIGEIDLAKFAFLVLEAEEELNRPINYSVFSEQEWNEKLANDDQYAMSVENSAKILLTRDQVA